MTEQPKPSLVIVNGMAGAGKSTLAEHLIGTFRLPLLAKDTIKEAMAEALGAADPAQSRRLGDAAFGVLYALARRYVDLGIGAILEAPFYSDAARHLAPLVKDSRPAIIQCHADRAILYQRVRSRAAKRHWSHFDTLSHQDTLQTWHTPDFAAEEPPPVDAPVLWVDTTDDYSPSLLEITDWVHQRILDEASQSATTPHEPT